MEIEEGVIRRDRSASLGDKGLSSSANILFILINVVRRVVFSLFLLCFQPRVRLFLPRETCEMFRHFSTLLCTLKTTEPRPQVFSVNCSTNWQFSCTIDVIFHTSQNSSKFGRQQLVVMNYEWDFSQSEAKKYYECNDCNNTLPTINMLSGFHDGSD